MPRPIDPHSLAGRIRQSFLDGRPFVAYEAPDYLDPSLLDGALDHRVLRLRLNIANVRRDARNSCRPADYDQTYPGDAGFACAAWAEPLLGCVYIGPRRTLGGLPHLRSIEARLSLAIGASAVVRLSRRSCRDVQVWLNSQSSNLWRQNGNKAPTPAFTVRMADGQDPSSLSRLAEYVITRQPDIPAGVVPPWRSGGASGGSGLAAGIAADQQANQARRRQEKEAKALEKARAKAQQAEMKEQAKAQARADKLAEREDNARKDLVYRIDRAMRQITTIKSPEPQWDWYTPQVLEAFAPAVARGSKTLRQACLASSEAMRQARKAGADPERATSEGLAAVRALLLAQEHPDDRE